MRIRIQELKLMRIYEYPDQKPWLYIAKTTSKKLHKKCERKWIFEW